MEKLNQSKFKTNSLKDIFNNLNKTEKKLISGLITVANIGSGGFLYAPKENEDGEHSSNDETEAQVDSPQSADLKAVFGTKTLQTIEDVGFNALKEKDKIQDDILNFDPPSIPWDAIALAGGVILLAVLSRK